MFEKVADIIRADTNDLKDLAKIAGGNPKTFYVGIDLSVCNVKRSDLAGFETRATTFSEDERICRKVLRQIAMSAKKSQEVVMDSAISLINRADEYQSQGRYEEPAGRSFTGGTISIIDDIGTQVGNFGIGAVVCAFGEVSDDAQLIAGELIDIAAVGARVHGESAKRIRRRAQNTVIKTLANDPAFASVNQSRVRDLLSRSAVSFTRAQLIEACRNTGDLDLDATLARYVVNALPFDGDDEATKRFVYLALEAGISASNADAGFQQELKQIQLLLSLQGVDGISEKQDQHNEKLDRLIRQSADKARDLHLTEQLFTSLAKRIATDVPDIDQAYRELERAVDVASEAQARSALLANTDAAVTAILARVDELNNAGQIDEAATHLIEEEARIEAGLVRVYDKAITQAVLTRNAGMACTYEIKRIAIEAVDPSAQFEALRQIRRIWYERGRDKGLNFDLEVSIALAHQGNDRAGDADQRGAALNELGAALQTLGERESDPQRLEQAVAAYRAALEEQTRDRVPLDWATTQNNLGNALQTLGTRERDSQRLQEAVAAYRAALEEQTRDRVPLGWAMTQSNLGGALQRLGERVRDPQRLEEAVAAYRAALKEYTQDRVPLYWAGTQNNLGNALQALAKRESDPQPLEDAVAAYRAALDELTRDRVPLDWAMTQNNLGNALKALGERENDTQRLEDAVAAYRSALEEWTRDRVPLDWAMTQNNLGNALATLGERESDPQRLEQAVAAFRAALEERKRDRVPLNWAGTQFNLAMAMVALADHPATTDPRSFLETALEHVDAALEIYDADQSSYYHEEATRLREQILDRLGTDQGV